MAGLLFFFLLLLMCSRRNAEVDAHCSLESSESEHFCVSSTQMERNGNMTGLSEAPPARAPLQPLLSANSDQLPDSESHAQVSPSGC